MLFELSPILEAQKFTAVLFIVYIICAIFKQHNILSNALANIKSDKTAGVLTILLSGCLPIPGRIVLCSSIIKSISTTCNKHTAVASYVGTHHYYLWSPLEKSVLITIAGLGITYQEFILAVSAPLVVYVVYMCFLLKKVKINRIQPTVHNKFSLWLDLVMLLISLSVACVYPDHILYTLGAYALYILLKHRPGRRVFKNIDYITLLMVLVVITIGSIVKQNSVIFHDILDEFNAIGAIILFSFIASYSMGSSSKFAGVCLIATSICGIEYLPLIYTVDFCGYLLSPCHKCRTITQSTHRVSSTFFNKNVGNVCWMMIIASGLYTWFTL